MADLEFSPLAAGVSLEFDKFIDWMADEENGYQKSQGPQSKGLRASSIWSQCARLDALQRIFAHKPEIPRKKTTDPAGEAFTGASGQAVHYWFQNKMLGAYGILKGKWRCVRCENVVIGTLREDRSCLACGGIDTQVYDEFDILIEEFAMTGHLDGILGFSIGDAILEIKTKGASGFDKLKSPVTAHVWQGHVYMEGLRRVGIPAVGVLFLYVDRGQPAKWTVYKNDFVAGPPRIKRFFVEWDQKVWGHICEIANSTIAVRKRLKGVDDDFRFDEVSAEEFIKSEPRRCATIRSSRAQLCLHAMQCFAYSAPDELLCAATEEPEDEYVPVEV